MTAIARLASALAPGKLMSLRRELDALVPEPLPADVTYEIILQSYLFFGYAQAIEAAKVFAEVARDKGKNLPQNLSEDHDWVEWRERGEVLCAQIYHPNFDRLVANMATVSPELSEWMVVEGYGKVLSRPGPMALEREVASIIFLAISQHPVQLYSHVRGARNLGATDEQLAAIAAAIDLTEAQREVILATIARVFG